MHKLLQFAAIIFSLLVSTGLYGQSWERIETNKITSIIGDGNGGAMTTEYWSDPYQTILYHYDKEGNKTRFNDDTLNYYISNGFRTTDGDYIFLGRLKNGGTRYLKYSSLGSLTFTKPYTNEIFQIQIPGKEFYYNPLNSPFIKFLNNDLEVVDSIPTSLSFTSLNYENQTLVLSGYETSSKGVFQEIDLKGNIIKETILPVWFVADHYKLSDGSYLGIRDTTKLTKYSSTSEIEWVKIINTGYNWRDYYKKRPNSIVFRGGLPLGQTNKLIECNFNGDTLKVFEFPGLVDFKNVFFNDDNSLIGISIKSVSSQSETYDATIVSRIDSDTPPEDQNRTITGRIFYDANNNCKYDIGEKFSQNVLVLTEPFEDYSFTDSSGLFKLNVKSDNKYLIKPISKLPDWQSYQCSNEKEVQITGTGNIEGVDFPIHEESCAQLQIKYNRTTYLRCFPGFHKFVIKNTGTATAQDIKAEIAFPREISTISVNQPFTTNNDQYHFNIAALGSGEEYEIIFNDSIDCRADIGFISGYAKVHTNSTCSFIEKAGDSIGFGGQILGSFDPNDKSVVPSRINYSDYTQGTRSVDYHINFQNTGDGPAYKVIVIDTLSNDLEFEGISDLDASHPYALKVLQTNPIVLSWSFVGINLQSKEVDKTGSQGYIHFSLPLKEGLTNNTIIENRAAIFFDFNEPIITNTATLSISDKVKTDDGVVTTIKNTRTSSGALIYPNPAVQSVNILLPEDIQMPCTISILNLQGSVIHQLEINTNPAQVNVDNLETGLYHYVINNGKNIFQGNLIVK